MKRQLLPYQLEQQLVLDRQLLGRAMVLVNAKNLNLSVLKDGVAGGIVHTAVALLDSRDGRQRIGSQDGPIIFLAHWGDVHRLDRLLRGYRQGLRLVLGPPIT
ncbi:hypothetical protein D3C76_1477390 [compost metagenome]